jgi:hypothetical protein
MAELVTFSVVTSEVQGVAPFQDFRSHSAGSGGF